MESQKVLCCGAKKWALVLGWIQAVGSAVVIGMLSLGLVLFVVVTYKGEIKQKETVRIDLDLANRSVHETALVESEQGIILAITGFVLMILAVIINFAAGVVLVQGVQNRNAKMLKAWMIIEFIFFVLDMVGNIFCIVAQAEANWTIIFDVLLVFISLFSFWVVNVYRQELLGNSGGQVIKPNIKL